MKKIFIFITFIFFSLQCLSQATKKVLFLGNSYTTTNNLPFLISNIARSNGDSLVYQMNAPGGYTLQEHSTNTTSLSKIKAKAWDFVVLQEQSQLPSFPIHQVQTNVFPYARKLDSLIRLNNNCTETMFFQTWGRKNGDASNCTGWQPVCTYEGMDSLLQERYRMMAVQNNAVISPAGAVWNYIRKHYPFIALYTGDGSHPSPAGSYAAACCFYTVLFRKNPLHILYDFNLPAQTAASIRDAVKTVVFDDMRNWFIGEFDPLAGFSYLVTDSNTVRFTNHSSNGGDYRWDFGDGGQSVEKDPAHNYSVSGQYTVTLITNSCNQSDTSIQLVWVPAPVSIPGAVSLYPNPVISKLTVDLAGNQLQQLAVFNSMGQQLAPAIHAAGNTFTLDLSKWPPGTYFIRLNLKDQVITKKIIKR